MQSTIMYRMHVSLNEFLRHKKKEKHKNESIYIHKYCRPRNDTAIHILRGQQQIEVLVKRPIHYKENFFLENLPMVSTTKIFCRSSKTGSKCGPISEPVSHNALRAAPRILT